MTILKKMKNWGWNYKTKWQMTMSRQSVGAPQTTAVPCGSTHHPEWASGTQSTRAVWHQQYPKCGQEWTKMEQNIHCIQMFMDRTVCKYILILLQLRFILRLKFSSTVANHWWLFLITWSWMIAMYVYDA